MNTHWDNVLVIDDSPLARTIARTALERGGFRVRTAPDGAAGLARIDERTPDAVLCDLQMPNVDGMQVLCEMQRQASSVPVLIFTDASEVDKAVEAMKHGAAGYILKGASDDRLAEEVRAAIASSRTSSRQRAELDRLATMGTLAANAAHEINNPLAFVAANITFVRTALENEAAVPDRESLADAVQALREAEEGIARIRRLVLDLKSLSRRQETTSDVELQGVLESAARMASPSMREVAELRLTIGELPTVKGDAGRLSQVFINLLVNAAQAIGPGSAGGEICLRASTSQRGEAVVEISDNGCGIAEDVKQRLFEPFFTTKPAGAGTGLGLPICQSIVAAHRGTIAIESTVGHGSTFRVTLPGFDRPYVTAMTR